MSFRHWRIEENLNIATLTLDVEGANANALSHGVLDEFDTLLTALAGKALDGVILRSAKNSFIVGADVTEFRTISDSARAADLAQPLKSPHGSFARRPVEALAGPPKRPVQARAHQLAWEGGWLAGWTVCRAWL